MVNTHYQTVGMLSLILTLLFFGKKYLKTIGNFLIGFLLTFIPLLIFELNNHWYNVRHMVNYLLIDQYKIWVPMSWTIFVNDFWPNFTSFVLGGTKEFGMIIALLIVFVFGIGIIRKKISKQYFF